MLNGTRNTIIGAAVALCLMLTPAALAGEDGGCAGDTNDDGVVDFTDIINVLVDFGCESDCTGDADGDGITDLNDLLAVLANFGCGLTACESSADCDDGDDCTIDICTPIGCVHIPAGC